MSLLSLGACTSNLKLALAIVELLAFNSQTGLIDRSPAHRHADRHKTVSPPFTTFSWRRFMMYWPGPLKTPTVDRVTIRYIICTRKLTGKLPV